MKKRILAFTLAETLTTLIVIGVIAVIALPALKGNVDEKTLDSQQKVFNQKLNDGLHRMQIKGELTRDYESTEAFVEVMKKHFNIAKVCPKDKLADCFGDKIRSNRTTVLYNLKDVSTSDQIDIQFSTPSNVMGLVFSDGVMALIAYKPNCVITNQWDTSADVTECLAMYYDVSGRNGSSIIGEDVVTLNVGAKDIEIGEIFVPSVFTQEQCLQAKTQGAPINSCYPSDRNYWANAVYQCWKKGKRLPTKSELSNIAKKMYDAPINSTGETRNINYSDENLWNTLKGTAENSSFYWTNEASVNDNCAYARGFYATYTQASCRDIGRNLKAFCLGD